MSYSRERGRNGKLVPKSLDASYQIRKLGAMRRNIAPDIDDFLDLLNEGLLVFNKKATEQDIIAIEEGGQADIDVLCVYANLLGTKVQLRNADNRPLVRVPESLAKKKVKQLLNAKKGLMDLKQIMEDDGITKLTFNIYATNDVTQRLLKAATKISDKKTIKPIYHMLTVIMEQHIEKLEEEIRILDVRQDAKFRKHENALDQLR